MVQRIKCLTLITEKSKIMWYIVKTAGDLMAAIVNYHVSRSFCSKIKLMGTKNIITNNKEIEGRMNIGLKLLKMWLSPDLKIRLSKYREGTMPVANSLLKVCERIGAISLIIVLSNSLLILPTSLVLLDFSLLVIFTISYECVGFRKILLLWLNEFWGDW